LLSACSYPTGSFSSEKVRAQITIRSVSVSGAPSMNSSQFTGRENDQTGLYFYRARYGSSTLQRFHSEDPLGFGGNDVNLYEYAFDSPTNYIDPSGYQPLFLLLEDPIFIDPELLEQAQQAAAPKQSLPMPDGGKLDLTGRPHFDKATQQWIRTPHVHDPMPPYDSPFEGYPRGIKPVPRPATPDDILRALKHNKPGFEMPSWANPMLGRKTWM